MYHGSFPLPDSDSDFDSDSKPYGYIVLCRTIMQNRFPPTYIQICSGGSKWAPPPPRTPLQPKYSRFHAVFGKIWQNRMSPPRVGAPSYRESWIRPRFGSLSHSICIHRNLCPESESESESGMCSFCWNFEWTHKNLGVQTPQNVKFE